MQVSVNESGNNGEIGKVDCRLGPVVAYYRFDQAVADDDDLAERRPAAWPSTIAPARIVTASLIRLSLEAD